jgi:hypothetical protein
MSRAGEDMPYSQGVLTFDLLSDRPGVQADGTLTLPLREFLQSYAIRIAMKGHPFVKDDMQRYHSLIEVELEG